MPRFLPALVALLALPALAPAHAVGVEAKLAGDTVRIDAFFDDDTPAGGAKVTVRDGTGALVAEGETDAAGGWAFAVPPAGKYTVRVDAGDGHATTTVVTVPPHPVADETAISAGASRAAVTGWQRWAAAAVGLAGIAAGTVAVRRRLRANALRSARG